jgi:hypothetical protein
MIDIDEHLLIPLLISGHRVGSDIVVTRVVFPTATVSCPLTNEDLSKTGGWFVTGKQDPFKIENINSWSEFEDHISKHTPRRWIYRGHMDITWKLESSLFRAIQDVRMIIDCCEARILKTKTYKDDYENGLISIFKSHAHLYLSSLPKKTQKIEWLSVMQHYGAPTRLLDWTFSPYIAAYFALVSGNEDSCIYALNHKQLTDVDQESLGENYKDKVFDDQRGSRSFCYPYEPEMRNERLSCQQGLFLVPSTNYETFDEILANYGFDDGTCIKYILDKTMRFDGLRKLRLMNVTSATLFPGIDGFCKSLKLQIFESPRLIQRIC